jgi:large subunit ribosomal protein L24
MKNKQQKRIKLHIRKGDTVKVLAGDSAGKQGVVTKVFPETYRAIVEGLNKVTRHVKPTAQNTDGKIQKEAPIHISNLMLVNPETGEAGRTSRVKNADGKTVRVFK